MDVLRRIQRIVLVLFIKYLQTDWRGERCLPRPPCNDMPCFWWGEYFVRFFLFDLRLFVGEKETRDFMSNTLCYFWSSNDFCVKKNHYLFLPQEGDTRYTSFMCWKINDFYNVSVVQKYENMIVLQLVMKLPDMCYTGVNQTVYHRYCNSIFL